MCKSTAKYEQKLSLFLVVFNLFIFKSFSFCPVIIPVYQVHVVNNLPSKSAPLKIHCASKDTDFGFHTLLPNEEFHWKFCVNFWWTTMYFCHFWWGEKDIAFEVYNYDLSYNCDYEEEELHGVCRWSVRKDGFYFGTSNPSLAIHWDSK
ncbi:hypothetical protein ACP275_08G251500 [Erythranthe tilingii]